MPIDITMPRLSDTMERGTVLKWNVKEGDAVASGDVVADIETDKATMELSVYDDGTVVRIVVGEGETVDVGTTIAVLAEDDEDASEVAAGGSAATGDPGPPATASASNETTETTATTGQASRRSGGRMRISPVARRLADEHGVDVEALTGTGPAGRIIKRDVMKALETSAETQASVPPSAVAPPATDTTIRPATVPVTQVVMIQPTAPSGPATGLVGRRIALSSMRQTIAKRLVESSQAIPHYQVSMTFDMDPLMALREMLNEQLAPSGVRLSVNDFLIRCCALAMYEHPDFNASWDGDGVIIHEDVNIGMAIAMGPERGGGLVVGVIHHTDQKTLRTISIESRRLAEKARTRGLSIEEMSGSTFTVSNLGMFGVDHFTAIINPPNSAILAVGGAIQKPVVRDGELIVGHEMSATLSSDHRIIDGAMAARYLQTLKRYIENPAAVMV